MGSQKNSQKSEQINSKYDKNERSKFFKPQEIRQRFSRPIIYITPSTIGWLNQLFVPRS